MKNIHTNNPLRVFRGKDGLKRYISGFCPPLVELPARHNPFIDYKVEFLLSVASQTPFGNIKALPALSMLEDAQRAGKLEGVTTVVEGSSGNTVGVLGPLSRMFGIEHVKALVPQDLASNKQLILRLNDVETIVHMPHPGSAADNAREMGKLPGHVNLGQYENEANPDAFERIFGPLIDEQTGGKACVIVGGLGTTGTMVGLGRYFEDRVVLVGVYLAEGEAVPGLRTMKRIEQDIRFSWQSFLDDTIEVKRNESFEQSLRIYQEGLDVGPSSGSALRGAFKFVQKHITAGDLDQFRNIHQIVSIVVICPDGIGPYRDLYLATLDPDQIPYQ